MSYNTLNFDLDTNTNVATVTLNRPDAANSLNLEMAEELAQVANTCDTNPAVRAVIITGAGKMFCAGGDVQSFGDAGDGLAMLAKNITSALHSAISRFSRMRAPLIVAVNGTAAGAGFSIALSGDIVLSASNAKFTMAYTGIGAAPDGSSSYFLPRVVGHRRAMELMLTNRLLSAEEAVEWGIVNRAIPPEELLDAANTLAEQLASGPTNSFGEVKKLLHMSSNNGLETQMEAESRAISSMLVSKDGREGVGAFLAKRKPTFTGE